MLEEVFLEFAKQLNYIPFIWELSLIITMDGYVLSTTGSNCVVCGYTGIRCLVNIEC